MSAHDQSRRTALDLTSRAPAALGAEVLGLAARTGSGSGGATGSGNEAASGPGDDAAPGHAPGAGPLADVLTVGVDTTGIDVEDL